MVGRIDRGLVVGALALGLAAPSCKQKGELVVKDSEGRSFTARCREDSGCSLVQTAGPKAEASRPILETRGRVVGVCDATGEQPAHPADCRPLVCGADGDCPDLHGPAAGSCLAGICVDPSHAISSADSVMMCLAGKGLGHEGRERVERYALGLNCGEPCVIPGPCQRPR